MTMGAEVLPVGKLPLELLARLLARAPVTDPRVRLGPGVGLDCAVLDLGERLLVLKSDPITFATDEIGWYLVQVNANDLATTGATPRWLLLTMLLPDGQTRPADVEAWAEQVFAACREQGISVIGGHTEVTYGLSRPVLAGTLIGEVERGQLVTPAGAQPGDRLLLTKGVPIEGAALLAREFAPRLAAALSPAELAQARAFLSEPGLSVVTDARIALAAGEVTAMHDPTEGGLAGALWELAGACDHSLCVELERVPVLPLAARVCGALGLDPLATLASGALLLTASPAEAAAIERALLAASIPCATIGWVEAGPPAVWRAEAGRRGAAYPRPARDEVARLYSETAR